MAKEKTIIDEKDVIEPKKIETTSTDEIADYFKQFNKGATIETLEKDNQEATAQSVAEDSQPKKRRRRTKKKMIVSGEILTGALFLTIIDMLLPMLIAIVNNYASKNKIKHEDLQLTREQQKQLEPIADEVMKEIEMNANPVAIMIIAMAGIYGMNFMAAKFNVNTV